MTVPLSMLHMPGRHVTMQNTSGPFLRFYVLRFYVLYVFTWTKIRDRLKTVIRFYMDKDCRLLAPTEALRSHDVSVGASPTGGSGGPHF